MSHNFESVNHHILEEASNVAKRASFDDNSLMQLEALANERARLVHLHKKLDEGEEEELTSVQLYGPNARGIAIGHSFHHNNNNN